MKGRLPRLLRDGGRPLVQLSLGHCTEAELAIAGDDTEFVPFWLRDVDFRDAAQRNRARAALARLRVDENAVGDLELALLVERAARRLLEERALKRWCTLVNVGLHRVAGACEVAATSFFQHNERNSPTRAVHARRKCELEVVRSRRAV